MKTKLSPRFWFALTLFSLIGQIAWIVENMYLNVFIYKMFNASAADISSMVTASAVAATLTTVLIGALSDKLGKRKIFICAGYILWGISILGFAFIRTDVIDALFPMAASSAAIGVTLVIVFDCIMTFFGSSANDAAFNAWLTDSTDNTNRGAAEGINAMMPLVAMLAVFGGFMSFDLSLSQSWCVIFTMIGIVVITIGIVGFFLIEDPMFRPQTGGYFSKVIYGFHPTTVKKNPSFYFFLLLFIIFNISIQIFMPYLILYYEIALGMTDYVFIMAPAVILAAVVTVFWGKIYDKKGFSFSVIFSLLWLAVGYILLYAFRATTPVFVGSLLMMCGYLSGMAVFGAKIRDLTPTNKAGMLQGVRICAQVLIPGIVGPFIGKMILSNAKTIVNSDGTESFIPNENIFLAAFAVLILLALLLMFTFRSKKPRTQRLKTEFEENSENAWDIYPRPQMKRASYFPLNGKWHLSVIKGNAITPIGEITVPFPPESEISGIGRTLEKDERYLYEKCFMLPADFQKDRLLLHFGAVDQTAKVFLNGKLVGEHIGGYLPFTLDVTVHAVNGENTLSIEVMDTLDSDIPYGKQRRKRGGMWYTPVSGIWQPVWLESVPASYISTLRLTPTLHDITIETYGGAEKKRLSIVTPNGILERDYTGDRFTVEIQQPRLWSPEDPYLYAFTLTAGEDHIESYFALRTISTITVSGKACLALNNKPYFFHGILDQGYFSDGIYMPASPEGFRHDIEKMKAFGFNMLRKHIKIEPDIFYYECDRLGMIVFQDMVNNGRYNFLIDTALPTIGLKKGITHRVGKKRKAIFESHAKETIDLLYNHPCVCYYTIFNEGWGQYDADRVYAEMKAHDPTRIYDATSGWFTETKSDVKSEHVYFKKLNLKESLLPLVLSEFGGYSCKIEGHSFNLDKTYGYRFFTNTSAFSDALEALYLEEVIPMVKKGLCAAVLTQVSDVEDETNGLFTYDRKVQKIGFARMRALSEELKTAFDHRFSVETDA